ncbi:uncharacterized protein LOC114252309 [Bombyx mandarina]|uniref:Uncharacterized protein n=2 Tax=Bombyx TaxID=7090 RepID=A0A8R1WMZ0_BOMMO|nr:uncharacterized protein LOC101741012 [Bombyx mori]XP_021204243.2 uncharacterized protein LOC101741012 [Bombyx mori]XP_028042608.1 uncharacterized protein LOC114252309 [Bombyx mandarina]
MKITVLCVAMMVICCSAQRSPYAGRQPIGFPAIQSTAPPEDALGNRFGDDISTTTIRLPIEALGDADLVNRLRKLPVDKQPFWLLNWLALEANRKNPQNFNQRPNSFLDNSIRNV